MPYIVDQETSREFMQNYTMLKRVKRINGIAFFTYLIGGLMIMAYSLVSMVGLAWDWVAMYTGIPLMSYISFILIIDTFIIAPLSFYLTYRVSILHHSLSGLIVLPLQIANYGLMIWLSFIHFFDRIPVAFAAISIYCLACIFTGAANMWAVVKYHWLEDQEGFPQFNPRYEEYKEKRREREIMDPYLREMQRVQKASNGEMNELGTTDETLEQYEKVHIPSNMDSI